jgi:hypothetical protein
MKKIITLILFIIIGFSSAVAQQPGDSRPLADKGSSKGRNELRHEKRVLRNERRYTRKNLGNHVQRDKSKGKYGVINFKKRKKSNKEKNKPANGDKPKL